jgi:fluoroquinolone transport system permease protein
VATIASFSALCSADFKYLRRDPMLAWLTVFPLAIALAMRWGVPPLSELLVERYSFDLLPYYPLILSFLLLTMPTIVGAIIGFMLLDARDDGTLTAVQVTPLTLRGYMFFRAMVPMLLSLIMTAASLEISGLMQGNALLLLLYSLVAAPLGPLFALFIASIARNKVQGFAIMKASGVISWPAIIAWFISMPWQLAFGLVPHYWMAKVVWQGELGQATGVYAAIAIIYQLVLLAYFLRRFDRVVTR